MTPTTPTGRRWLMGELEGSAAWGTSPSLLDRIEAIETEAAQQERERLREAWYDLVERVEAAHVQGAASALGLLLGGNKLFAESS